MRASDDAIPVCAWIRMTLPGIANFIGFTYVDCEAGLSAKGGHGEAPDLAEAPALTVRLPMPGSACEPLRDEEIGRLGLPRMPSWVEEFYGPQPLAGKRWGEWRRHPRLTGRFHPEHPDDLQVIVHEGGPRRTSHRPELIWVRVTGCDADVFRGRLLNRPHQLNALAQGAEIDFVVPEGGEHPLLVTPEYLRERRDWVVAPCSKCGLTELLDVPSELVRAVFPSLPPGATMAAFTAFCGLCGGVQVVQHASQRPEVGPAPTPVQPVRRWWQFGK